MEKSLSFINSKAKIGKNVTIEPFVTIQKNVEIGDETWIGPYVTIMEGARIGKNCKIFPGAVISSIPQDLKFVGEESTTEIGDNTIIREYVTVNRGTKARGKTTIGNNCLLMTYSHIAHDCEIKNNVIIGNADQIAGEVVIDDFAILSAAVLVHQFVHIGSHVMVSGGSLVRKDVPPYIKAAKDPLSFIGINSIGLKRRGFDSKAINEIQNIYRLLFLNKMNNSEAIEQIKKEIPQSPERNYVIDFVTNSERGIMKGINN